MLYMSEITRALTSLYIELHEKPAFHYTKLELIFSHCKKSIYML